jgi:hypothetical protein
VTARADLTDAQCAVLKPLLPKGKKPGRRPKWSKRQLMTGFGGDAGWARRGGMCRRSMGPGKPCTACFGVGSGTAPGPGCRPGCRPARTRGLITWNVSVDSTIARPGDFEVLVGAVRARPSPIDLDLVIGVLGPLSPPEACGLVVPVVAFDQLSAFDRDSLLGAIPTHPAAWQTMLARPTTTGP